MNSCPHCGNKTIGAWAKWRSRQINPTQCSACQGLSFVPHAVSGGIFVGSIMLLAIAGFTSSALQNVWVLVGGGLASIAFYAWRWAQTSLTTTTGKSSVEHVTKRNTRIAVIWLLITALFN